MTYRSLLAGLLLAPALLVAQAERTTDPDKVIGMKIDAITVEDTQGPVTFKPTDAAATVVVFVSAHCPVSNAYNARMNALNKDYADKNIRFIFADANVTENLEEIRKLKDHATHPLDVPTYRDADNALADKLDAHATPEAYVIDKDGIVRYHGAIDNNKNIKEVTSTSLRTALDEVLAGKTVTTPTTRAFGCSIKRKKGA
jgi:protein-disulfide isomerase